jgi:hypothetical protein
MRAALLLSLLLVPALQEPPKSPPDEGVEQPTSPYRRGAKDADEQTAALTEALQGAWSLKRVVGPGVREEDGERARGFALFADGYLSILLHFIEAEPHPFDDPLIVQANVSRYHVRDADILQTITVMGHDTLSDAEVALEPTGQLREFRVSMLDPNELILTKPDDLQLVFGRIESTEFSEKAQQRFRDARRGRGLTTQDE